LAALALCCRERSPATAGAPAAKNEKSPSPAGMNAPPSPGAPKPGALPESQVSPLGATVGENVPVPKAMLMAARSPYENKPGAKPRHIPTMTQKEQTAAAIFGVILRDNARFARKKGPQYFDRFAAKQHPRATVVACADSRFHEHALDRDPDDDLFVIRNIGNQVDSTPGSVKYGVRHLHTPLLLIVGHVKCGAVRAVMEDYGDEHASIRRELDGLHIPIFRTMAEGTLEDRWLQNVIGNVHEQVHNARVEYEREVRSGKLVIVGAVYDFLDQLGEGRGKVVVVNVNGERDPRKFAAYRFMREARAQARQANAH
jgi:carbonic anhydrase